jgi:peptidoglycan/LPS O-acetylase OafA/YrhL
MNYRADIDGLRAVAVLPVVLYHVGLSGMPGGFVGVDVFFVISGFLITQILVSEIEDGRFSLGGFYERRIRRIAPAFLTVLAATTTAASLWLLPVDFDEFSSSALTALMSASNIFFFLNTGYFSGAADLKPLLHTWSLGVEEQFYVILPVFLAIAFRFGRRWVITGLAAGFALSFGLSIWLTAESPSAAFYLLPPRACELLVGSLLVFLPRPAAAPRALAELAATAGIVAVVLAVLTFSRTTAFPGAAAMLPAAGAALVIYAGSLGPSLVSRLLSLKPIVFIGLISYSLYLWHWPIMVFPRYLMIEFTPAVQVALITASLVAAVLSWHFVEKPFRTKRTFGRRAIFTGAAGAMSLSIGALAVASVSDGWRSRFSPDVLAIADVATDVNGKECHDRSPRDVRAGSLCVIGDKAAVPQTLVWGDSHAWSLQHLFADALKDQNQSAYIVSRGGCLPVFGIRRHNYSVPCEELASEVGRFIADRGITRIVLVANWGGYLRGVSLSDDVSEALDVSASADVLKRRVEAQIRQFLDRGTEVVVLDPLPGAPVEVARSLAISVAFGRPLPEPMTRETFLANNAKLFEALSGFDGQIRRVQLWKSICATDLCDYVVDGHPLYTDQNHPAKSSFAFAAEAIAAALVR